MIDLVRRKNKLISLGISICFFVTCVGVQFRAVSAAPGSPAPDLSGVAQSLTQAQALASARMPQPRAGVSESTTQSLVTEQTSGISRTPLIGVVDQSSKLVGVLAYQAANEARIRKGNAAPQSPVLAKLPVPEAETLVKRPDGTFVFGAAPRPSLFGAR